MVLTDLYGRPVLSLRIQLNTTCNFNCFFCHMEGTEISGEALKPEEIERVVKIAHKFGVNKIKLTGGEPTLRRDLIDIVKRIRKYITGNISMTTNGVMLPILAYELKKAGLDRVNISMHAFDEDTFQAITGVNSRDRIIKAIDAANEAGLTPVKINFVVLRDLNVDQIPDMIELAAEKHAILQLIEYETTREGESSKEYLKYHMPLDSLEKEIADKALSIERNELHNRPRYIIRTQAGEVKVEFVKPQRNPDFCAHCTRLRITSEGEFKTCLMRSDTNVKFKGINDEKTISELFRQAVLRREPYWRPGDEVRQNEVLAKSIIQNKRK
ncbi:molybdenum cofactor biosynthesis protein moaA [Thermoplasma volcanium GSS1]|uniref:Probable GTP 3',8-cyclase n=1 Tax=Thermoplasma volcanium (strain ATCC 51530 / DSM 4299 / JCM 9571 / NBRC 15438 / GSS1) TaxID=273116 RepID=MOAA_THEVO|nr:GTP 3',8-cyclase MoaA [Thermoplasma volcanium]Q979T0.1 RecName: Full=Probable GTP 3',8-cyclase; AltName: Full=Molybdenum cofactor biosynthesis protein A [Thermoplasma volcanium GSS1]BAB60222.1 molybdenum cofactor biosynthesis protein moaA [Thermoplasma volcanium GSS1]